MVDLPIAQRQPPYISSREPCGRSAHKIVRQPSGLRKQTSKELAADAPAAEPAPCVAPKAGEAVYKDVMTREFMLHTESGLAGGSALSRVQAWVWRLLGLVVPDVLFALRSSLSGGWKGKDAGLYEMYGVAREDPPELSAFCAEELGESGKENSGRVEKFLRRMRGITDMRAIRFLAWFLPKLWRTCFTHIYVNYAKLAAVKQHFRKAAEEDKAVLILPTHRSHVDYLLLSYLCYGFDLPLPHIAAGENLNIPVVGPLFAAAGAFFMKRRMKGEDLYKRVFYSYMLCRLKEGKAVEFFLQGGRTRTGQVSDPKVRFYPFAIAIFVTLLYSKLSLDFYQWWCAW